MRALAIVLLLSGPAATSAGGEPDRPGLPLAIGNDVRLRTGADTSLRGVVVADDAQTVTLLEAGRARSVPRAAVSAGEVSVGRKRHVRRGALIGTAAGALLGLALRVDPERCRQVQGTFCGRAQAMASGAASYALIGTAVGALVRSHRWVSLDIGASARDGAPERPDAPAGPGVPLLAGQHVRVQTRATADPLTGTLAAHDANGLVVQTDTSAVRVPHAIVERVDTRVGTRRGIVPGLALGAGFGFLMGAAVPVDAIACRTDPDRYFCSRGQAFATMVAGGAGMGALVGGLVKQDDWARVDVRAGLAPAGSGRGLAVGLVIRGR